MDKNELQTRTAYTPAEVHLREKGDGTASRTIEGYAILFNSLSAPLWKDEDMEAREVIEPSAITKELLDNSDIKMTMFHDMHLILARSKKGEGTLSYDVDNRGVKFSFNAPNTSDGDKAIELVKRGDIDGCSFMFTTRYWDHAFVEETSERDENNFLHVTYHVKNVRAIYDFTLTPDPAYPETSCEAREMKRSYDNAIKEESERKKQERAENERRERKVAEMLSAAKPSKIY